MIALTFYLFNDWFIYQIKDIQNDKASDLSSNDSMDMQIFLFYLMFQNVLLQVVLRLSAAKLTLGWRNWNSMLQVLLMTSSVFGLWVYVLPLHSDPQDNSGASYGVTEYDMTNYDKKMWKQGFPECPWLSIVLHMAVLTPFLVIFVFMMTICIVLCVYLKEHFKGFKRLFSSN